MAPFFLDIDDLFEKVDLFAIVKLTNQQRNFSAKSLFRGIRWLPI
jgi:hypothetical protein